MPYANFDCLSVGLIDFDSKNFEVSNFVMDEIFDVEDLYFDLASMTKPLTFGVAYLELENKFTDEMNLLIHHKAGLPFWGRLDAKTWKEQISSYQIKESQTVYSDFGALRLQLEIEKVSGKPLYDISSKYWDKKMKHWSDLTTEVCAFTGRRNRATIHAQVHDDNAFMIKEKVSHAGLFATIDGVCQTLININEKLDLITRVGIDHAGRYIKGWDSVEDLSKTLAGANVSKNTFGHLGFTGTSMWIDPEKKLGCVILSNEVNKYWYDREVLNKVRRDIGTICFS